MDTQVRETLNSDEGTQAGVKPSTPKRVIERVWSWAKRHHLFLFTVVFPTFVATIYYGLIASDVYISTSQFIVHSPQQTAPAGGLLGQFLAGAGMSRAEDAAYAVENYIQSRDALRELDTRLDLRKEFSSQSIDVFDRFPGLRRDQSFEQFYEYYGKRVGVTYDPSTSISVLTVSAFTASDAYKINSLLLSMSERLVNNLNDRSREDTIRYAEDDVKVAEQKATQASLALLAYRNRQAVFAPDTQASIELEAIAKLQSQLISTDAELAQLKQLSPGNPQIPGLQSRAATLRSAIAGQASKVTGGRGSLSARAPEFERLALESSLADKELGAAFAELDATRRDAARQQLYLERLVQPNRPDDALLPKRLRSIITIFAVGMILWGVVALVLASIREHTE